MEIAKGRVAVIGLDGASWDFMDIMMELGAMPHTKHLLNKAARGVLRSYPPVTPPAWASITTGVNPGKHGIFGFVHTNTESGEQRLTTALDLEHPRIYEMLAMQGLEALVFNPIPPYPIIPLKNLKIASVILSPKPLSYPKKMRDYARSFPPDTEHLDAASKVWELNKDLFLELKLEKTHERVSVVKEALEQQSWSLAWIRLQEPDNLLHPAYDEAFSGHSKVIKIFTLIDKLVETARNLADLVVLVSDHGFKKYRSKININTILYKHGFTKPSDSQSLKEFTELMYKGHTKANLHLPSHVIHALSQPWMRTVKELGKTLLKLATGKTYVLAVPDVDPLASKAYLPTRYNYGVVVRNDGDIEAVKNVLLRCKGIVDVKTREMVYWGPYIERAPHLMIYFDHEKGYIPGKIKINPEAYSYSPKFRDHHPDGIACFIGEDVTPVDLGLINTWDVTPTIMAYMKVPIPYDTDGRILSDVFNNITYKDRDKYTLKWRIAKKVRMIGD